MNNKRGGFLYIKVEKIIFKGKQNIAWNEVEKYLKRYSGNSYIIKKYDDVIQVNSRFASEYTSSNYTHKLRGGLAKVKANIVQILPELIINATNRRWIENKDNKHNNNAIGGWYRYDVLFSMPVKGDNEKEIRYNYYKATLVVRINDYGNFLYDIINIKKEARKPADAQ